MDPSETKTLRVHRQRLKAAGDLAYTHELSDNNIDRLCTTLCSHLKLAGYAATPATHNAQLRSIVRLLFAAQDERPMFHVEGTELPLCWNAPKNWNLDYIKYEWGHIMSRNQNSNAAHRIDNLGLYSARCNQHIQTSLDVPELMLYGGIIAQRVSSVLTSRRKLFTSPSWTVLEKSLPKRDESPCSTSASTLSPGASTA